ncbi:hypothetical protein CC78DRAFT_528304 [Lojkania enalia]|uniref:Uncharacterized protein n=1 Tax=Lojkania enalia TaxID=147567 RepID=A0A9P4TRL5_9PLEO|nr:hypothetical protein CC78DRAFT_528304 [Didymosphaeria enalia]
MSPKRPPQLNETICGCRCGCGCTCATGGDNESDDGGASSHTIETLVASNDSDSGNRDYSPRSDALESLANAEIFEVQQAQAFREDEFEEFQPELKTYSSDSEDVRFSWDRLIRLEQDLDDFPDSLKNEPHGSDDHSSVTAFDLGSIRCISPGPGIGAWTDDAGVRKYHFLVTPLRLTPQRRYCRGLVASHLVLGDDRAFTDT